MREQSTGRGNPSELSVEGNVRGEKRLLFLVKTESQGLDLPSCWKQINIIHSIWSNSLKTLGVRHGGKLSMRDGKHKRWLPGCPAHCLDKDSRLGAREGNAGRAALSLSLDGGDGAGSLGKPRSRASRFPLKLLQFGFQSFWGNDTYCTFFYVIFLSIFLFLSSVWSQWYREPGWQVPLMM